MTVLAFVISFLVVASVSSFHGREIISGWEVDITQCPYQVLIAKDARAMQKGVNDLRCGGSIIGMNLVLTAAHCLDESLRGKFAYHVLAGTSYVTGEGASWHRIIGTKIHENYEVHQQIPSNDIGLVMVEPRFHFDERRRPISLAYTSVGDGTMGFATGWGDTNPMIPTYPRKLRMTVLSVVTGRTCGLREIPNFLCGFGEGGRGTCYGDSGGPLTAFNRLVGITSYGTAGKCGVPGRPDVFTNVTYYIPWIMANTPGSDVTYS